MLVNNTFLKTFSIFDNFSAAGSFFISFGNFFNNFFFSRETQKKQWHALYSIITWQFGNFKKRIITWQIKQRHSVSGNWRRYWGGRCSSRSTRAQCWCLSLTAEAQVGKAMEKELDHLGGNPIPHRLCGFPRFGFGKVAHLFISSSESPKIIKINKQKNSKK